MLLLNISVFRYLNVQHRIRSVAVTIANNRLLCNTFKEPAYVEFLTEHGDVPRMKPVAVSLQVLPDSTPVAPEHIIRVREHIKGYILHMKFEKCV